MADMVAKFGIAAAERGEDRYYREEQLKMARQQYGDQEFQRMSADIAAGMSFEEANKKYGVTQDQYDASRDTVLYDQIQTRRTDTMAATGGYVDQQVVANPDYITSGAWQTDDQMLALLGDQWNAWGNEGDFDMSNPAHSAWATAQVETMAMGETEMAINRYRSQDWYRNLSDEDREGIESLFSILPVLEATGGYKFGENPDGSQFITDNAGTVVWGNRSAEPGAFTSDEVDGVIDWVLNSTGQAIDPGRAAQFLRDSDGEMPASIEAWNNWNSSVYNPDTLHEFFSSTGGVTLTKADRQRIPEILEASKAVAAGTATPEQAALAAMFPEAPTDYRDIGSGRHTLTGAVEQEHTAMGDGTLGVNASDVYKPTWTYDGKEEWYDRAGMNLPFTDEFRNWITGPGAGTVMSYQGTYYQISPTNPINSEIRTISLSEGNDTWNFPCSVDTLNVINMTTGEEETLEFDYYFNWED